MISSTLKQRLQDLANNVDQDLKLLKEFEDALRYETNPRIKAAYRQDIEQLRESVRNRAEISYLFAEGEERLKSF